MPAWRAIAVTVVAATGNNIGKALQKQATMNLPRFSLDSEVLHRYMGSTQWLLGMVADLGGGLLMIAAFALAPVSLVQPVSSIGLVSLALFSRFYLHEVLHATEWVAIGVAVCGIIGLGATTEGLPPDPAAAVHLWRMVVIVTACIILIGASLTTRHVQQRKGHPGAKQGKAVKREAAWLLGLHAGTCFGLSAACCRTGILLAERRVLYMPLGLGCSVVLTSTGLALQTCGLKDGSSMVVCTAAAVSSMVSSVAVGAIALGEGLPATAANGLVRWLSWMLILIGVIGLAAGSGGARRLAGLLASKLPGRAWPFLPQQLAASLRSAARAYKEHDSLPQVITVEGSIPDIVRARLSQRQPQLSPAVTVPASLSRAPPGVLPAV